MIYCVNTAIVQGIEATIVKVECDVSEGLPGFEMVGYLSSEVKEAGQRVKAALKNAGYHLPAKKVIVNFSPASIRKSGTGFDLSVLLGVAVSYGIVKKERLGQALVVGEVSLSGKILPVDGILPIVCKGKESGFKYCIVPKEREEEACLQPGIKVLGVDNIKDLIRILNTSSDEVFERSLNEHKNIKQKCFSIEDEDDFSKILGNEFAKRATLVAVCGLHNLLYIGAPGAGKTMLARSIPSIMPTMTEEEALDVTKIYSVSGLVCSGHKRPFRAPHHSSTIQSLIGGGSKAKPGEISLAHKGVLFLDELPEFQSRTLEALRQPLEDRSVCISRVHGNYIYPSQFMLVAAMNPCPCGYYPDLSRCKCNETAIKRYLGKVSGPLMDRMDLCVEVSPVPFNEIAEKSTGMSSKEMKNKVLEVHEIQRRRFEKERIRYNSEMNQVQIEKFCILDADLSEWISNIYKKKNMSVRGYHRLLRVARTIADISGHEKIKKEDIEEALLYKNIDGKYWGR